MFEGMDCPIYKQIPRILERQKKMARKEPPTGYSEKRLPA